MSGFLPPLVLELRAKAGEVKTELAEARKEMKKTGDEADASSGRMTKAFHGAAAAGKVLAIGAIGIGVAIGGFAVEAAMAGQNADALLSTALKNAGSSFAALKGPIEDTDSRMRKLGYTNVETNTTLAQMTVALGDPKKAMADLSIAADIARLKHISLAQAGLLVAKAAEGQTRPLRALGIDLPVVAGGAANVAKAQAGLKAAIAASNAILVAHGTAVNKAGKIHDLYEKSLAKVHAAQAKLAAAQSAGSSIMAALTAKVHGTAAAYGSTLQGKIAAAHAQLDSLGETLGNKLIPIITKVIGVGTRLAMSLMKNKPALIAIGAVIGTVVVTSILAYIASLVVATATSIASFASMIAKGAVWAATQTASLTMMVIRWGLYGAALLAQKAIMVAQIVVTQGAAAAQWLLNAALTANPIGLVIAAIVALVAIFVVAYKKVGWFHTAVDAAFKGIKIAISWISTAVGDVISFVKSHWQTILAVLTGPIGIAVKFIHDHWTGIVAVFTNVKKAIGSVISDVGTILLAPFKWAFNMIATIWNNTIGKIGFTLPGWLGGGSWHMPKIPTFAAGGVMAKTGLAIFGENGPELGILPGGTRIFRHGTGPAALPGAAVAAGGGGGSVLVTGNIFVGAHPATGKVLADMAYGPMQSRVLRSQRRTAANPFTGLATA